MSVIAEIEAIAGASTAEIARWWKRWRKRRTNALSLLRKYSQQSPAVKRVYKQIIQLQKKRKMQAPMVLTKEERALFKKLQKEGHKIITPSFLRVERLVSNTASTYQFDITETGNETPTEQKLNRNDLFVATSLGLYLMRRNPDTPGADVIETYPNSVTFNFADVTLEHLYIFYSGKLSIRVDQTVWFEALDTRRFLYIPETQRTVPTNFSSVDPKTGMIDVTPNIRLYGNRKNEIKLTVATWPNLQVQTSTGTDRIYVVFYARGLLVSGGAYRD